MFSDEELDTLRGRLASTGEISTAELDELCCEIRRLQGEVMFLEAAKDALKNYSAVQRYILRHYRLGWKIKQEDLARLKTAEDRADDILWAQTRGGL